MRKINVFAYRWLFVTQTLKGDKAIIRTKKKIVWDNQSSSYQIWISIGFTLKGPVLRVLDLQKVLARVLYGVQLSKCFELSRVHYIWNLIHHKDENMAGLTPDKQTIVYLHENTYFVNLKNNYYWISQNKLLLFLSRTFYWALLWLSWNSFDLHFWGGGLSTLTLQINSN